MEFPDHVYGPLVIEHLRIRSTRCKHVYIVGEAHSLKATCAAKSPSSRFLEVVKTYARLNPTKTIALIYEDCFESMVTKTQHTKSKSKSKSNSMLDILTDDLYKGRIPDNVKVIFGDARFMEPFDKITALYEHETVLFNRYRSHSAAIWQDFRRDFMKSCKQLEKHLIKATVSRTKMARFVRALLLPSHPYPKWFSSSMNNPIKDVLGRLSDLEYKRVKNYISQHMSILFADNNMYSPAFANIAARRRTLSSNLEFQKHDGLKYFMIMLFSLIMDVYILCQYLMNKDDYDMYIILVGAKHAQNMSRFLNERTDIRRSKVYRSDDQGCIDTSLPSKQGPIDDPMFEMNIGSMGA